MKTARITNCHVMSMLRLWWIPYGETADQGAYVHYPVDDRSRFWHSKVNVIAVW